jgi:hypothetical protein
MLQCWAGIMPLLTVEEFRGLLGASGSPCISIYFPTARSFPESEQNAVRFANQVRKAEDLLARTLPAKVVAQHIEPLHRLGRREPWNPPADGFALFSSEKRGAWYNLPLAMPERVVVADSFHVRPLVRFLQANQHYFLLYLSKKQVRLCKGSVAGLVPIDLSKLPHSMTEALGIEERERQLTFHAGAAGGSPVFHGGGSERHASHDLAAFFRVIDQALHDVLRDEKAPLILAGPVEYHPIFQSVSRYAHLLADGLHGNFDAVDEARLHEQAWPLVAREIDKVEKKLLETFGTRAAHSRGTTEVQGIARAALEGRVETLMVARGRQLWGSLDKEQGTLRYHDSQRDAQDDDILDELGEAVLLRGGQVWSLLPERMPQGALAAAIYRW